MTRSLTHRITTGIAGVAITASGLAVAGAASAAPDTRPAPSPSSAQTGGNVAEVAVSSEILARRGVYFRDNPKKVAKKAGLRRIGKIRKEGRAFKWVRGFKKGKKFWVVTFRGPRIQRAFNQWLASFASSWDRPVYAAKGRGLTVYDPRMKKKNAKMIAGSRLPRVKLWVARP